MNDTKLRYLAAGLSDLAETITTMSQLIRDELGQREHERRTTRTAVAGEAIAAGTPVFVGTKTDVERIREAMDADRPKIESLPLFCRDDRRPDTKPLTPAAEAQREPLAPPAVKKTKRQREREARELLVRGWLDLNTEGDKKPRMLKDVAAATGLNRETLRNTEAWREYKERWVVSRE